MVSRSFEVIIEMGLFTKYCEVCGVQVTSGQDFVRFGKHFCSEDHAKKYASEMEQRRLAAPTENSGGC
jgi:hypothetical protein